MSELIDTLRRWADSLQTCDPDRQFNIELEVPTLLDAADRIAELEAPYVLTDKMPTEPGFYVFSEQGEPITVVNTVIKAGSLYLQTWGVNWGREYTLVTEFTAKWGSAPLPIKEHS